MLVWSLFQQASATLPAILWQESSCLTASSCPSLSISALEWWGVSYSLRLLSKDLVCLWPFQKLRACNSCLLFQMPSSEWHFITDSCVFSHWAVPWILSLVPTLGVAASSRASSRSPLLCKQWLWWEHSADFKSVSTAVGRELCRLESPGSMTAE